MYIYIYILHNYIYIYIYIYWLGLVPVLSKFILRHSAPFLQFLAFWVWCPFTTYSKILRKFDLFLISRRRTNRRKHIN